MSMASSDRLKLSKELKSTEYGRRYSNCIIALQVDNKYIFEAGQQGSKLHQQLP